MMGLTSVAGIRRAAFDTLTDAACVRLDDGLVHLRGKIGGSWYTVCERHASHFPHDTLETADVVEAEPTCLTCITYRRELGAL